MGLELHNHIYKIMYYFASIVAFHCEFNSTYVILILLIKLIFQVLQYKTDKTNILSTPL